MLIYTRGHVTMQAAVTPYRTERVIAKNNVRSDLKCQLVYGVPHPAKTSSINTTNSSPSDIVPFQVRLSFFLAGRAHQGIVIRQTGGSEASGG